MSNITFVRALQAQGHRVQVQARVDGEPVAAANLLVGDLAAWEAGVWAAHGADVAEHYPRAQLRTPGGLWL